MKEKNDFTRNCVCSKKLYYQSDENFITTMFMHPWQISCLTGGEGVIWGERGVVDREGDIQYKLFLYFLDKINKQLLTFAFILLIWDIHGISSV